MDFFRKVQRKKKGFTLIEVVVFLGLFGIISMVFFQTYIVTMRTILESKNRLGATALANQRMEIIRSLPYDNIGTKHWNGSAWVYGIPAGELIEEEDISVNTTKYHVDTFVQYVDDTFDGVTPTDTIPTDYKKVRVTVSWGGLGTDQTIALFGNFSPNGVESASGGGTLSINVLNAAGLGVSGASVRIQKASSSIDTTATTDATGNVTLPGAPAGTEAYTITISKSGFYGANTFPAYPTTAYNPVDVHATVVAASLNQKSIVMDEEVDITLKTEDPFGTDIPSIGFTLAGGRVLGVNPSTTATVYKFSSTSNTDTSGEKKYDNESYGQYTVTVPDTADYAFWKITPEGTTKTLYDALPGVNADITAVMLDKNIGSLKASVVNDADGSPVAGASVKLSNATLPYDVTLITDTFGEVYFPDSLPALTAGTYDIEISKSGFTTKTDTVTIGSVLESETYNLVSN
jgi:type II secretory pathway pseudopilin PulG